MSTPQPMTLRVSETFESIQGEGKYAGTPAWFLRLAGCSLKCRWCDSAYAMGKKGKEIFVLDLVKQIGHLKHVVITGGEPLEAGNALNHFILQIPPVKFIEIETNGTVMPHKVLIERVNWWSVSPKLSNSGVPYERRIKPEVINFFNRIPNSIFKFVLRSEEDFHELIQLLKKFDIKQEKLYLMPEGTTHETLRERSKWLIEKCKDYNWRYSPRLQIHIYGNVRGK